MYAVLHARNCYSKNHRYITIYPERHFISKKNHKNYLQQSIGDIIAIMKDPLKKIPFLSYGYAKKIAMNQIDHIFQRSKAQPRIKQITVTHDDTSE